MKAVTAKTVKTEMASGEVVNLPKPNKTAVKAVKNKIDTKINSQDVARVSASTTAKPAKITADKLASQKVTTKTEAAKAVSGKVGKPEISKPESKPEVAKISVEKTGVAKSGVTKPGVTKSTTKIVSATKAKNSKEITNPEPMKLLVNEQARPSRAEIEQMIAKAAYFRAEKRCFEVGYEQEDWLMAEQEISQLYLINS
jgi:hypothetical protein